METTAVVRYGSILMTKKCYRICMSYIDMLADSISVRINKALEDFKNIARSSNFIATNKCGHMLGYFFPSSFNRFDPNFLFLYKKNMQLVILLYPKS